LSSISPAVICFDILIHHKDVNGNTIYLAINTKFSFKDTKEPRLQFKEIEEAHEKTLNHYYLKKVDHKYVYIIIVAWRIYSKRLETKSNKDRIDEKLPENTLILDKVALDDLYSSFNQLPFLGKDLVSSNQ